MNPYIAQQVTAEHINDWHARAAEERMARQARRGEDGHSRTRRLARRLVGRTD